MSSRSIRVRISSRRVRRCAGGAEDVDRGQARRRAGSNALPTATDAGFSIKLKLNAAGFHARNCAALPTFVATLPLASELLNKLILVALPAPPQYRTP